MTCGKRSNFPQLPVVYAFMDCSHILENKPYKAKNTSYNRKDNPTETAAKASEFAGSATHYIPNQRMIPNYKSPAFAYIYHLQIMQRICRNCPILQT